MLFLFNTAISFSQSDIRLLTQFINPCGNDGSNEFIIGLATTSVDVGNMGFAAINHTSINVQPDYNWYWYGKNVINAPRPTFTPNLENCGVAGSGLSCFRILDPGTPADATAIDNVRNNLNSIAGCNVFLPVPVSGVIPGGLFAVFLGAAGCGLDAPATNLNFSNHCSGGTPTQQYYLLVGNGNYGSAAACSGGYFVNASGSVRTSVMYNYIGGGNTIAANYQSSNVIFTTGAAPTAGNAAVIVPDGMGGSYWLRNAGCVPSPLLILDEKNFSITETHRTGDNITLYWKMVTSSEYDYFALEKSDNGIGFNEIKKSRAEPGNSFGYNGALSDEQATNPLSYYRIKAVAMDGKVAYSNVKIINNLGQKRINLFPNPATGHLNIRSTYTEELQITINDLAGREILRRRIVTPTEQVDISKWPMGFYTFVVNDINGRIIETHKFIKQ